MDHAGQREIDRTPRLSDDGAPGDALAGFPVFGELQRRDFEASPCPMRIFDRVTLRYLAVNDAAVKFYGRSREEFLSLTIKDTRHPGEHPAQLASLEQSTNYLRHGGPRRQFRKSGEIVVAEVVTQDILFEGREARLTLTIDLTARLRVQELLWREQQEFKSLAENLPDLVARYDRDRRFVYVNSAIERALGTERGRIIGRTQRELGLPDDIAALYDESLAGVFETSEPHKFVFRHAMPDGERMFEAHHVAERGASGTVESVLCVARDISDHKRIEQVLRETNEFLRSVIESSWDCIKVLDLEGRLQMMNASGCRLLEIDDLTPLLGTAWQDFWVDRSRQAAQAAIEAARGGGAGTFEGCCATRKGALKWWDVQVTPIPDAAGRPVRLLAVSRDISERKQTELAVRRSAELARLLESLASAANEAMTPEAAMTACLNLVCAYGGWVIGRVALYGSGKPGNLLRSIWNALDRERYAEFIRASDDTIPNARGVFLGRVAREQVAMWVEDLEDLPGFGRKAAAERSGLRTAFGFPIVARGELVAIIEMFSEEPRARDPLVMGAAQSIASQLARIVEREWAQQSNARMAAIVESSQDAIMSRMLDGTIVSWNPAAERLLGYTAEEIIGRNAKLFIPPELHPNIDVWRVQLARGQPVPTHETWRLTKDGRRIPVSATAAPIRDSNGEIWGFSSILRDISTQKIAERELLETQQHLQVAVRGGGVGLYDWDVRTGAVYFSPEWKRQLGCEDHEIRNDFGEWERRIHPDDRERVAAIVQAYLANPAQDYQQEYRMMHRDGSYRWILSRASVQLDGRGKVERMFGCHVDITDQKRAEAERLEIAVRQRDALVREVHHRIKNSLQGVVGLLGQKILKKPAIAAEIGETIAQLQSVALVYGLQETRPDGLLDLGQVMDAIISSAEDLIGGRVDRVVERRSRRPACLAGGEAVSVAFALNELIFNALKHQRAAAGSKRARVSLRESAGAVEIRISNRGRLPAGFDFARGRAVGNGLGLVRTLLAAPGGTVAFNGGGNQVEVVLELRPPLLAGGSVSKARRP